jgi:hypothetical protein
MVSAVQHRSSVRPRTVTATVIVTMAVMGARTSRGEVEVVACPHRAAARRNARRHLVAEMITCQLGLQHHLATQATPPGWFVCDVAGLAFHRSMAAFAVVKRHDLR